MIFRQRVPERLSSPALLCVLILLAAALPAWSQKLGSGDTQRPGLPFSEFIGLDDSSSTRAAIDTGTSSTSTSTSTDPLPSDAAALLQQFGRTQTEIRREADKKIAEQREQLLRELKELQDRYTREAKLDEAVAIRDQIRELRVRALTGGQTLADPGSMYRYRDRIGQTLFFDIVGATNQYVWGTDVYTDDSSLATAAVHAGVLRPGQKGIVRVTIVASPQNFQGSTRNGVTSYPWGTWSGAYRVEPVDATLTRTTSTTSSDSPNWSRLAYPRRTEASQIILMEVVGDTTGYVWGTDVYTDDSIVATAAVHAGLLQPGERGTLQMIILPGRNSYEGSTRNGVTSYSFPNWPRSFRLQKVSGATTTSPLRNYYNSKTLSATMPGAAMGYAPIPFPFSVSPGSVLYTDVVGSSSGYAWGTDIYTSDSSLATAAVHSGLLKDGERGRLKVTYLEGRDNYPSTTRNGVTSQTWAAYPSSIRLELAEKAGPP